MSNTPDLLRPEARDHTFARQEGEVSVGPTPSPVPGDVVDQLRHAWMQEAWQVSPDGIVLVNSQGIIMSTNASMQEMSGYTADELVGQAINIFLPAQMHQRHSAMVHNYFLKPGRQSMGGGRLLLLQRKDGRILPVDIALSHFQSMGQMLAVAFVRDMSTVQRMAERINFQACHDSLTELKNRGAFFQSLQDHLDCSQRTGQPLALLLLDLDNFKAINDGYGHAAGDGVIVEVARRLRQAAPETAILGRLGGDEFVVLLPQTDARGAHAVATQILHALHQPCPWGQIMLDFGVSIGIALAPGDVRHLLDGRENMEPCALELMRYADMAMYRAKDRGRGNFVFYEPHMGQEMAEKVLLSERLRAALQHGSLELYYQPQLKVASDALVGAEVLLRWRDPILGEIPPERFIPVAESSGLIVRLGHYVLDAACRQLARWLREGRPMRLAVNLSMQQLRQNDLVQQVRQCLQVHQVPAQWLELEVTESQAMQDPEHACRILQELAALGVGLVLDDFGNGYSSLAYLQHLPVQRLKLGRDFMCSTPHGQKLLGAIIHLAHTMGWQVVAEGVETVKQRDYLQALKCCCYQGWLNSKAMSVQDFDSWREQQLQLPGGAAVPLSQ